LILSKVSSAQLLLNILLLTKTIHHPSW